MRPGACGLVVLLAVGLGNGAPPPEKARGVVKATGTLEPEETVDVGAQVDGKVVKFGTDAQKKPLTWGSVVKAGDLLAQLDSSSQELGVKTAKTAVLRAEAELRLALAKVTLAQRELQRLEKKGEGVDIEVAKASVDVAKATAVVAEAGVAQARTGLERAELHLRDTAIRSPIDGVILDRRVNVGQVVVSSLNAPSLFLIAKDLKKLQVWTVVDEADIARVAKGQKARFTVDTYRGDVFGGKVSQIRLNATLAPNKVTYIVVIDVDNSNRKMYPFLTASVTIDTEQR